MMYEWGTSHRNFLKKRFFVLRDDESDAMIKVQRNARDNVERQEMRIEMFAKMIEKRNEIMINTLQNGTVYDRVVDAAYAKMNDIMISRFVKWLIDDIWMILWESISKDEEWHEY